MLPGRGLFRRALRTPPKVVAYRAWQEARIRGLDVTGGWYRCARRVARFWSPARVADAVAHAGPVILAPDAVTSLRAAAAGQPEWRRKLLEWGDAARARRFHVLGAELSPDGPWPWHSDWRFGKRWAPRFFRRYDPYERRDLPYDIKMPWELSRLWFLIPQVQAAALDDDAAPWAESVLATVTEWERENPLAYSVNWHPMEASMRGIVLILVLDALAAMDVCGPASLGPLLRLVTVHGEFVRRTVEYNDPRGNHYTANVVALLLIGERLRQYYPRARAWADWAARVFSREVLQQFHPDGVNIEQSLAYHRFVTELFLLGLLASRRAGRPLGPEVEDRLHRACRYSRRARRPDGLAPNVGDNDDARILCFDPVEPRDHGPVLDLGAALFDDPELRLSKATVSAAVPWLLGESGVARWQRLGERPGGSTDHWRAGGVVVVRTAQNLLWMDVGEVGMGGRGGHGHNDLGSFELVLGGVPLIVDSGCPVYSGNPALRDRFRSTAAHNTLAVDGEELAPMSGLWRIGPDAAPHDVSVEETDGMVRIEVTHEGYRRLPDPVTHQRQVTFDRVAGCLRCRDRIDAHGPHKITRRVHFHPHVAVRADGPAVRLRVANRHWRIRWDRQTRGTVEPTEVSSSYAVTEAAQRLSLATTSVGGADLWFEISPIAVEEGIAE